MDREGPGKGREENAWYGRTWTQSSGGKIESKYYLPGVLCAWNVKYVRGGEGR